MFAIRSALHICAVFAIALAMSQSADAQTKGKGKGGQKGMVSSDRVPEYFADYDLDGNGHITRAEWLRRGNFERLDTNKNGTIELSEFRIIYGEWGHLGALSNPILPAATPQMDPSLARDRVGSAEIGQRTICGISRSPRCPDGDELGTQLGLFETGLGPSFPPHAQCVNIDEHFAMDYVNKTGRGAHGGIDIPTDYGTPILAVAAGTVLAVFEGSESSRGRTIVLRHSPEETGLPFWVYTEYGHFNAMPTHRAGQRVRMARC